MGERATSSDQNTLLQEVWHRERENVVAPLDDIISGLSDLTNRGNTAMRVNEAIIAIFANLGYKLNVYDRIPPLYRTILNIIISQLPEDVPDGFHLSSGYLSHSSTFQGLTPRQSHAALLTLGFYPHELTIDQIANTLGCNKVNAKKLLMVTNRQLSFHRALREAVLVNPEKNSVGAQAIMWGKSFDAMAAKHVTQGRQNPPGVRGSFR